VAGPFRLTSEAADLVVFIPWLHTLIRNRHRERPGCEVMMHLQSMLEGDIRAGLSVAHLAILAHIVHGTATDNLCPHNCNKVQ